MNDFIIIIIIIIIIFTYFGMTLRSNFSFQSVSETPFLCLYCKKQQKERIKNTYQQQKGKNTLITTNKYKREKK